MKGLLLNQYYVVEKSLWFFVLLGLVVTTGLLTFDDTMFQRLAAFLPILLLTSCALEVLKHESKSGWNKFVLTLPVTRNRVVQSHYLFFSMLTLAGLLVAGIASILALYVFNQVPSTGYVFSLMNILSMVLIMGFVAYPLTYLLGTEKGDFVIMAGGGSGIGVYLLSAFLFDLFLSPLDALQGYNMDLLFSVGLLIITFVLFVISYVVSVVIFQKKEV